jgi:membrane fusion protein, multidrug efflux system
MQFVNGKFLFFAALIFFIGSCKNSKDGDGAKGPPPPPAIEGLIVKTAPLTETIEVSGTLLPMDEAVLMPEVAGRITQLNLPEGARVSKGTLLVKLYDGDLQAQLGKLNAQLQNAKINADRLKELLRVNGISQAEYEQGELQVATIGADIAGVRAEITKTEIRAPFDGTIGLRKVSEGAYVSPGTEIAVIRADQQLKLDFDVPGSFALRVAKGMPVTFTIPGDTATYAAEVIATEENVSAGTLNLRARALVRSKGKRLVPGTAVAVGLHYGAQANAILVPTEAIIPQARFKTVIVSRKGKAEFTKVQTGVRLPSQVEILSGLQAGDTIVVTGIQFIRPGSVLKFSSVK